jgi:prephenate dehydratase
MILRIAIQGEAGSNSHMATVTMLGNEHSELRIVPCNVSAEVMSRLMAAEVDAAVLPIENSLHGSVAEHYDLLLELDVRIERESLMRIRHNLIAFPGVKLEDIRQVFSHPVALSQCRKFFLAHPQFKAMSFYDTAGAVKHVMAEGLRDTAGVAPMLAAKEYGGEVLLEGIEDNPQNFTRFHLIRRAEDPILQPQPEPINKMSLAFAIDHRPGTLVAALERLAQTGVNLTKIESRPVPGSPWEYVFYVDVRFESPANAETAVAALTEHTRMLKVLGSYRAAEL